MITMLIGLCMGFIVCYMLMPSLDLNHHMMMSRPPEPPKKAQAKYTHDEEGVRLQTLEMLEIEDYISTEGNSAELFILDKKCKIRVNIVGETYYRYRTFYFNQRELSYAMQSLYRYPNGGLSNMDAPNAFQEELYSTEIFNPQSSAIIAEFDVLLTRFSPTHLAKC